MPKIWEPQDKAVYRQWIKDIVTEASDKLSDWETKFVDDIERKLDYTNLTQGQAEKLEQIYVKYTS